MSGMGPNMKNLSEVSPSVKTLDTEVSKIGTDLKLGLGLEGSNRSCCIAPITILSAMNTLPFSYLVLEVMVLLTLKQLTFISVTFLVGLIKKQV